MQLTIDSLCQKHNLNDPKILDHLEKLIEYVGITCKDREPSHGLDHMKAVTHNALKMIDMSDKYSIGFENINEDIIIDVIICTMLHDVADHKYDKDGTLFYQLVIFLNKHINDINKAQNILTVIKRVSFSQENKWKLEGKSVNHDSALSDYWLKILRIVQDSDRLEAIGEIGLQRCEQYALELYPTLTREKLNKIVVAHSIEKLLKLYDDHFISTEAGRELARPLHMFMKERLVSHYGMN